MNILDYLEKIKNGGYSFSLEDEPEILALNNPELSYYFALNVKGANIKEHEKIVINSNDPGIEYISGDGSMANPYVVAD